MSTLFLSLDGFEIVLMSPKKILGFVSTDASGKRPDAP